MPINKIKAHMHELIIITKVTKSIPESSYYLSIVS